MANDSRDNLRFLNEEVRRLQEEGTHRRSFDGGGGGGYDHPMEERVKKLEATSEKTLERLTAIERDLAVVGATCATREDLHKEISAQTWKLVTFVCGFGTALVAATYFIVKHAST